MKLLIPIWLALHLMKVNYVDETSYGKLLTIKKDNYIVVKTKYKPAISYMYLETKREGGLVYKACGPITFSFPENNSIFIAVKK